MSSESESLRGRLTSRGEDALGKLAQDLLENPLINSALARAFDAREKAAQAQEVAMGALNLPSAADIERLTRRLRSVSQRLEGIEDGVDRLDRSLAALAAGADVDQRLSAVEGQLAAIARQLSELRDALPGSQAPIPRAQERLAVDDGAGEHPRAAPPRSGGGGRAKPAAAKARRSPAKARG